MKKTKKEKKKTADQGGDSPLFETKELKSQSLIGLPTNFKKQHTSIDEQFVIPIHTSDDSPILDNKRNESTEKRLKSLEMNLDLLISKSMDSVKLVVDRTNSMKLHLENYIENKMNNQVSVFKEEFKEEIIKLIENELQKIKEEKQILQEKEIKIEVEKKNFIESKNFFI